MADFIPKPDREAEAYMVSVVNALNAPAADASGNVVKFGVPKADITAVVNLVAPFTAALNDVDAKKVAQQNSVTAKDTARTALETKLRALVARIQVAPAVTDASKTEAHLPLRDKTRSFSAPVAPQTLKGTPFSNGVNRLEWLAGGNQAGVQYVIEQKLLTSPDWFVVDAVTARKYDHKQQTVGNQVSYRVRARRGAVTSDPSNVVVVYAPQ